MTKNKTMAKESKIMSLLSEMGQERTSFRTVLKGTLGLVESGFLTLFGRPSIKSVGTVITRAANRSKLVRGSTRNRNINEKKERNIPILSRLNINTNIPCPG